MARRYDLVVLGGGTAGLVGSMIAAAAGARVAMIERDRTGGDCLWTGCVPSKALIASAGVAHLVGEAGRYGISVGDPEVDFPAVMERVRATRREIEPHDSPDRLREAGVEVLEEEGRFLAPGLMLAGSRELRFRSAIVATGSSPALPPVPGLGEAGPLTTETVWDLERLPGRLVVVGGGPVGCELGQAFARLGSRVTVVEEEGRLLAGDEPEASELVAATLASEGVELKTGRRLARVEGSAGEREVTVEGPDGTEEALVASDILIATGRVPRTAGFGLEALGVGLDGEGAVAVDRTMRTTAAGVFAAGDVTGAMPFTHVAAQQARVATPNALFGLRQKISYSSVPAVTFTDPEIARVGIGEAEARRRWGSKAVVVAFDYGQLDRAITDGAPRGFAKLVAEPDGTLAGATVAATGGGEAIGEMAAWLSRGASIADISRQVHAYPTLAEGPSRAAHAYLEAKLATPRNRALARTLLAALRGLDRVRKGSRSVFVRIEEER